MTCNIGSWRANPLAPEPGTSLGSLDVIPDRSVREFQFGVGRRVFSMLVVRRGDDVRAYVNACPHVWLPLTFRGSHLLSADGERLVCSNHFAQFSVDDGHALSGPVEPGCGLAAIPVHVNDLREIVIGDERDKRGNHERAPRR
jgi:nitrite reductase/ring-hydroxylating ferredoxin subunit